MRNQLPTIKIDIEYLKNINYLIKKYDAVVAQGPKGKTVRRPLWVRSPFREMNYYLLIFSFRRPGTKEKVGVEFRHSTLSASKNSSISIL